MQKKLILSLLLITLLISCAPQVDAPAPTTAEEISEEVAPSALPPTSESSTVIRYAILAPTTPANIWALFDKEAASYENYAVQAAYYPRIYDLTPPSNELTPRLANGFPSSITQEGAFFTSTLSLLPNLKWDDGSLLTAEDIAFTINTVLDFELGLNWATFYNKEKLDHVEAVNAETLKYYFSSPPSVGDWQYGALIGVFASKSYWHPKIVAIQNLLPTNEDAPLLIEYKAELDSLQPVEKNILDAMKQLEEGSTKYRRQELLLNENIAKQELFKSKIETNQREKRESFAAARAALYALPNTNEPRNGFWQPSAPDENTSKTGSHFQITRYSLYQPDTALQAMLNNEIDFILSPDSLNTAETNQLSANPNIHFFESQRNDIRFLAFNHNRSYLDDIALRRTLSCLIDTEFLANTKLDGRGAPALGWIPPANIGWHSSIIEPPCFGLDADARLVAAMRIMQKAGYAWEQEPSPNHAGSGLKLPSGADFPSISLLAPLEDPSRTQAASYIAETAQQLGIPLRAENIPADDLFFTVYGINDYDLAIIGWSLSVYPDYLCDFFAEENSYHYSNSRVSEKCAAFSATSEIALARQQIFEIEVLLWDDLPAIPLFSSRMTEAYRNLSLPFEQHLGGIAPALYGAPTLFEPEK